MGQMGQQMYPSMEGNLTPVSAGRGVTPAPYRGRGMTPMGMRGRGFQGRGRGRGMYGGGDGGAFGYFAQVL
jgi:pre-mRNA 3'-end-processing factor FIP1